MFNIENIFRVATAAVGALVLTTVSVGAAVGPARMVETTPMVYAQTSQALASGQAHA